MSMLLGPLPPCALSGVSIVTPTLSPGVKLSPCKIRVPPGEAKPSSWAVGVAACAIGFGPKSKMPIMLAPMIITARKVVR